MWKILCVGSAGRQLKLRNTSSSIDLPCAEEEARIWKLSRRREDRVLASGLRCRRSLRVPLLTARHRTALLQWARAHQDWLLPQWRDELFSDESRFGLVSDDYRERVWRERGGQNRLATAIGVAPYRGGTQMFWGSI
nr:unnamed protein product [Callosobruchus chinensis]